MVGQQLDVQFEYCWVQEVGLWNVLSSSKNANCMHLCRKLCSFYGKTVLCSTQTSDIRQLGMSFRLAACCRSRSLAGAFSKLISLQLKKITLV